MSLCTRRDSVALTATVLAALLAPFGAAAQTVKIRIVGPFAGPFAHYGTLFKNGAAAWAWCHRHATSSRR